VRPVTAIISADTGPTISAPLPQDRSMSLACREIPESLRSGTKPNGHGPVRKSSANPARSGSGSKGIPRGIVMSPGWTKMSARGSSGPNSCSSNHAMSVAVARRCVNDDPALAHSLAS
jgi:hypothetical protein